MKTAIILGSARSNGNTYQLAQQVAPAISARVFDLADYRFADFDYRFNNQGDDFLSLIQRLIEFDTLVLASPVYWYAPSAPMKRFMDRLADLLKVEQPLGRRLRVKAAAVIATGCDPQPADCFEACFRLTFGHLGMCYRGMLYRSCDTSEDNNASDMNSVPGAIDAFIRGLRC